ncbi:MAG: DUF255 domain-containing protein [Candidatus Kapabacteria bacterium]|nr:DUF255 domain-containing protein [Candidatus Kapabacteria bacterium]
MRKLIVLFLAVTTVATMYATDGTTFTKITAWSEALDMAKATGKPIFLDAYTDWCGWCKKMDKETFSDPRVAEVMNASFVCVKMEMETGEGIDVSMKYRISGFPLFMVFSPDGIPTYRSSGYQPAEPWLATLADMKDPAKKLHAPGITAPVRLAWPEWHRASYGKGNTRKFPDTAVVRAWLAACPESDRFNEVAWSIIVRYDIGEKWESWAFANEAEFKSRYGDEVDALHERASQRYFQMAVAKKDPTLLDKAASYAKSSSPAEAEHFHLRLDAMYNQRVGNWAGVGGAVRHMAEKSNSAEYATEINEYSWSIYEKSSDPSAIADATWAMGRITAGNSPDWANLDTYAALLYKGGKLTEAGSAAQRAIDIGKAAGADVSETEALLVKIKAGK